MPGPRSLPGFGYTRDGRYTRGGGNTTRWVYRGWVYQRAGINIPEGVGIPEGMGIPRGRYIRGSGYTRGGRYTKGWVYQRDGYTRGVGIPGVGIHTHTPLTWDLGIVGKQEVSILLECFLVFLIQIPVNEIVVILLCHQ